MWAQYAQLQTSTIMCCLNTTLIGQCQLCLCPFVLFLNHMECVNGYTGCPNLHLPGGNGESWCWEPLSGIPCCSVVEIRCGWFRSGILPLNKNLHISKYPFYLKETMTPFWRQTDRPYFGSMMLVVNEGRLYLGKKLTLKSMTHT